MGSKTTKQTKNETAVATPNLPSYAQGPVQDYYGMVGNLQNSDWSPYTPPNSILQNVFAKTGSMSPGTGYINAGAANTQLALGATPKAYSPKLIGMMLGDPTLASAPQMGTATLGDPAKINIGKATQGYSAQKAEPIEFKGGVGATGGRASTYLKDYENPVTEYLVNATMAGVDYNAGRQRAGYQADLAKRGAFGGSRSAIGEVELMGEQARNRALADASIRSAAFDKQLAAAAGDAQNETTASVASSNNLTAANISQNQINADLSKFNAGEQNKFGLLGMEGTIQGEIENARIARDYGLARYGEDSANNRLAYSTGADMAKYNAGIDNDYALTRYGTDTDNARLVYNTDAENNRFNADQERLRADQRLNQAGQLAQIGGLLNSDTRDGMALEAQIGQILQAIQEDQTMAPAEKAALINQLITGGGLLGTVTGQTIKTDGTSTSKESGGLMGDIIGAVAKLGSAAITASDIRVKRDIEKLGEEPDGLGVYRYNYVWDGPHEPSRLGVMAQEVALFRPWALGPEIDGIMTVRYDLLEAAQ